VICFLHCFDVLYICRASELNSVSQSDLGDNSV